MQGIDLIRLRADRRVAVMYLERAVELAETDVLRAYAAVEDARKVLQSMSVALHTAHISITRR